MEEIIVLSGEANRVWRFGGVVGFFCVCDHGMGKW